MTTTDPTARKGGQRAAGCVAHWLAIHGEENMSDIERIHALATMRPTAGGEIPRGMERVRLHLPAGLDIESVAQSTQIRLCGEHATVYRAAAAIMITETREDAAHKGARARWGAVPSLHDRIAACAAAAGIPTSVAERTLRMAERAVWRVLASEGWEDYVSVRTSREMAPTVGWEAPDAREDAREEITVWRLVLAIHDTAGSAIAHYSDGDAAWVGEGVARSEYRAWLRKRTPHARRTHADGSVRIVEQDGEQGWVMLGEPPSTPRAVALIHR